MRHHGNASERRRIQCEVANEVSSCSVLLKKPIESDPMQQRDALPHQGTQA